MSTKYFTIYVFVVRWLSARLIFPVVHLLIPISLPPHISLVSFHMLQWVFGEFSVMPVMTSMGMLFTLFHNVHCYVGAHNLADTGELFWWEGAF